MVNLEDFKEHLETISQNDWNRLFDLLPEIDKRETFGEVVFNEKEGVKYFPYCDWSEVVTKFVKIYYDLNLVPIFDWVKWEEGKKVLKNNRDETFENYDIITLCMFLGTIIRADRFSDGYIVGHFNSGTISKILMFLKNKIHNGVK